MTSKNYLSNKKNVKMSFSTSPALTDWVKRYVNAQRKKFLNDERYKSNSSFIHHCLEYLMKIFEKGKTLDDFDRFVDQPVESFYDKITFKAIIPLIEEAIEMYKYIMPSEGMMSFYNVFRKFFIQDFDYKDIIENINTIVKMVVNRFENFLRQNNISESITVEKDGDIYIFEFKGYYRNLHFDFSKSLAAILGITGFKILNSTYIADSSINHFYTRYDCEITELFKKKNPKLREQIVLGFENIKKIIKYEQIITDKSEHIWLNISNFKGAIISFKDVKTGVDYIMSKIEELKKSVDRIELPYKILMIFEHFHWITIDNNHPISFHYIIPRIEHETEFEIMEEILSDIIPSHVKMENQVIID